MDPFEQLAQFSERVKQQAPPVPRPGMPEPGPEVQEALQRSRQAIEDVKAQFAKTQQAAKEAEAAVQAHKEKKASIAKLAPKSAVASAPAAPLSEKVDKGPLKLIREKTAAEVCQAYPLDEKATLVLNSAHTPREFLDSLIAKELFPEAIRFLAYALPKPAAVWWACLCIRHSFGAPTIKERKDALAAAARWVLDPSEQNRRAAEAPATAAGLGTPFGLAAIAAFWSGGSMNPPNLPPVAPKPTLTSQAVCGAVRQAANCGKLAEIREKNIRFIALGIDIAKGKVRWNFT